MEHMTLDEAYEWQAKHGRLTPKVPWADCTTPECVQARAVIRDLGPQPPPRAVPVEAVRLAEAWSQHHYGGPDPGQGCLCDDCADARAILSAAAGESRIVSNETVERIRDFVTGMRPADHTQPCVCPPCQDAAAVLLEIGG